MTDPTTYALSGAAALVIGVLVILLFRLRRQTARALTAAAHEQASLARRIEELERARGSAIPSDARLAEFVITDVGSQAQPSDEPAPGRIEGRLFADIVMRETLVKAASWGYGVRQVLTPQARNRIRFEMKQETKRAGRRRKADVREALRQYYARERGDVV